MTEKRICMCGSLFTPIDENDNLCKRCLLREYRALRARLGRHTLSTLADMKLNRV